MFVKILFFSSIFFVIYAYLGYPASLFFQGLIKRKSIKKKIFFPPISVVIAAHNEERYVARKIEDLLRQDYPLEKMEIILVSDGSDDKTEDIVRSFQEAGEKITLCTLTKRSGKAVALNLGVSKAKGEIIIFSDIRQIFKSDAIKQLVANFSDSNVGAVSGELFLMPEGAGDLGGTLGIYWQYEKWIRKQESQIDSVIGVTGAVYALRKNLFEPVPAGTILDDVLIPMRLILKGFRVVFDETAKAYDDALAKSEYKRKVRTMMGNFQVISIIPEAISYKKNRLFVKYVSHKVIRLLVPAFLITTFIANLFMLNDRIYLVMMILQILFYSAAVIGFMLPHSKGRMRLFSMPYTFVMLNWAVVIGFYNYIIKNENIWVKD